MTGTKKRTGDLAQTSVTVTLSITGTTVASSTAVSAVSSIAGLAVGQSITGAGIPANTTIAAFATGSITLSQAATASASGVALTVTAENQVLGLMDWHLSFKVKNVDATTTDDSAWESSLNSSKSWTVKAKYVYLMGDTSQQSYVRAAIGTIQGAQLWNFFPTDQLGDDAFTGLALVEGIDIAAGVGKIIGMDVSMKGTGPLTVATQLAPIASTNTVTGTQAED